MCEICVTTGEAINPALDALVEQHPATGPIDGIQVARAHHVAVAVMGWMFRALGPKEFLMLLLASLSGMGIEAIPSGQYDQIREQREQADPFAGLLRGQKIIES